MEELQNMRTKMEQYRVSKDPALQKTMSVSEMRKLLGLKKTESYWLVHRNFFKTEIIGGVTYKLKLSGGDIKAVQGDSGHAQADMVTEVYGHIIDEDRRKNAEMMENAFYNKENLNPRMKGSEESSNTIAVPEGVDAELLMKVLGNPEMAALLTSLARTMKV